MEEVKARWKGRTRGGRRKRTRKKRRGRRRGREVRGVGRGGAGAKRLLVAGEITFCNSTVRRRILIPRH